jgi:hypothetical protein
MTVSDEELLASLGYKQGQQGFCASRPSPSTDDLVHSEFKRAFTPVEVFGLGFSIIGLIPSIAFVLLSTSNSGLH